MGAQKFSKNKKGYEEDTFKSPGHKKPGRNLRLVGDRVDNRTSGRIRSTDVQAILDEEDYFEEDISSPPESSANSASF